MRRVAILAAPAALALCVAGCSSGQVGALPPPATVPLQQTTLQFAVGTATLAQTSGGPYVGLNVVATFRQPGGEPASVENTPSIAGPADFSGGFAQVPASKIYGLTPAQVQAASHMVKSTPQFGYLNAAVDGSLFTSLVGVFGDGLAPLNIVPQTMNATVLPVIPTVTGCFGVVPQSDVATVQPGVYEFNALRYNALLLPLFAGTSEQIACEPHVQTVVATHYYGGPPAWPSPQGFGYPVGFPGFPLGFTDFATPPVAGNYSLSVALPANDDASKYSTKTVAASLPQAVVAHPLPLLPQPALRIQSDGSAFIDVTVPNGVKEAIVLASSTRCDNAQATNAQIPDQQYGLVVHAPGRYSLFLKSNLGPPGAGGAPLHTFCTSADTRIYGTESAEYSLTAVGFDYPAYEASYPQSTSASPALTNGDGHSGTADLTAASPVIHVPYPLQ